MSATLLNILPDSRQVSAAHRVLKPTTQAIPLLNSEIAKVYNYAHTGQLLVYYYLRAGSLVTDPLNTMVQDLLPLAISQSLFCAICLPSVGNWYSGTDAGEIIKGSAAPSKSQKSFGGTSKKRLGKGKSAGSDSGRDAGGSWPSRLLPISIALVLALTIPTVPLMILALVLGAPLYPTNLLPHTMVLCLHISLLTTLPLFYTHGVSAAAWKDVSAAWLPFDEAGVWAGSVGTVVGAWVGAIPMALDWDRDWQKWPCTVLWAAVIGWSIGRLLTNGVKAGIGKRIDLSVTEYSEPTPPESHLAAASAAEQKKVE